MLVTVRTVPCLSPFLTREMSVRLLRLRDLRQWCRRPLDGPGVALGGVSRTKCTFEWRYASRTARCPSVALLRPSRDVGRVGVAADRLVSGKGRVCGLFLLGLPLHLPELMAAAWRARPNVLRGSRRWERLERLGVHTGRCLALRRSCLGLWTG